MSNVEIAETFIATTRRVYGHHQTSILAEFFQSCSLQYAKAMLLIDNGKA